jgi:NADH:ubiquinone oxidoreductase subunit 6 (subunit J)
LRVKENARDFPGDDVMVVLSILVFAGALVLSVAMIVMAIAPQWNRIVRLAMGHVEPAFMPLATLATAERRIAVRRWASNPASAPVAASIRSLRAAA